MSRWDILLDRTNQAKIKTDYVNEVNKENEKKYWKERCDKAQDKFFDMIKAEELKEIFDLYEALGGPRFYWEHELGRHPYEVNPQWKDVCPDSRWAGGPDYTEDRDLDRIGIGTRHGSGRIAYIPCLRMRFDDPDWGINWNYLSVEIYLNKDNHIILHQDGYSYSDRHSVDVFNAMDENKRTAIIYEHFVKAYPEFIKNFERIAENEIQKKEMLKDFFIVRVSPEVNEIFNKHIDYLQDRLDHLKLYENGYYLESCSLNCFLKDMNYYKEHYEKDLVEYKDKIKMYERICEPESRLIDRNKYLGMNYQNINVENIKKMTTDYENILDERICQVEAKLKEMETIKLRKDEMGMVEMKSDTKDMTMDEDRKDAILHCLADETLEYVYDRTSTGFYYVSTDNLRFTANERFDINLTDEDLSKIYDYMNLDFYVLDSECEWDEDENGEYFGIAVGSDRVNGDYCDLDEERYELRQTLFDEMCEQHPIEYDADKECLTLPDGRVINNMLSREQAVKHYEDYIYKEVNQNQEVKEMTEMLYGDELEKDDLEECL